MRSRKSTQLLAHVGADVGKIGRALLGDARHLEAAAQVERGDVRKARRDVEAHARHSLPHRGVGSGADVGVQPADRDAMARGERQRVVELLVPDAEAGAGTAGVGAVRGAAPEAGIHPDGDLATREDLAEAVELVQRARVVAHAAGDERVEPS